MMVMLIKYQLNTSGLYLQLEGEVVGGIKFIFTWSAICDVE